MHSIILCLFAVVLMPMICAWIAGYFRYQKFGKGFDNKMPRLQTAKLEGVGQRACAAQANCWEALAVFSASVLALFVSGVVLSSVATLCVVFVVLRAVYIVCYLTDHDTLRSTVFLGGFCICVYFFYLALTA